MAEKWYTNRHLYDDWKSHPNIHILMFEYDKNLQANGHLFQ